MIRKSSPINRLLVTLLFCSTISGNSWAQQKTLTYEQAFSKAAPKIFNDLPDILGWLDDAYYLSWKSFDNFKKYQLMKTHGISGESEVFIDFGDLNKRFSKGTSAIPWADHNKDYSRFIITSDKNLYLYLPATEQIKQLTDSKIEEKNPKLSYDGKKVAFTRGANLFVVDLESGEEIQLTYDGSDVVYNGWASWVYYEEIFGRQSRYAAFWWSPNSQMIAFMRFDDSNVPEYPIFHCEGPDSYLEMQRYPKPGDTNPSVKLGIINLTTNKTVWIDTKPEGDDYTAWPFWAPDSKRLYFQWMNREQDKLQIRKADLETGKSSLVYEETQSTWVEFFEDLQILKNDAGLIIRSDRDGWRHLYHYDLEGKLINKITEGDWDVEKIVKIDEKNMIIYFLGFQENSTSKHLFVVKMDGKDLKRLTSKEGTHNPKISEEGNYFIDTFNSINHAGVSNLHDSSGLLVKTLGKRQSMITADYSFGKKELFSIDTDDGVSLPASWVLPPEFDKTRKYPVIFKVYGGPGRASVVNRFPSLSDHFYAHHDIIIMYLDHRGSKHFGKKGAVKMYRSLGKWEISDLIQAVKWLRKLPFIDANKMGIVGGSYGGYVACLALTNGADFFTHGIAKYSVTDWRFYDSVYTERYMDQPSDNPDGYKSGSAMTYTGGYKGKLLITHGALDDNVHMQNTIEFVQELQKASKDFQMMIYPNQRHGIRGKWRSHATQEEVSFWFRHFLNEDLILGQNN